MNSEARHENVGITGQNGAQLHIKILDVGQNDPAIVFNVITTAFGNVLLTTIQIMPREGPLKILIFGTGAVGSIFGWRAAQTKGVQISTICRSNYDAVRQRGLRFKTKMWGGGFLYPDRVSRHAEELQHIHFDYVVCAIKPIPHEARAVAESLRPVAGRDTTFVIIQNGVGVEQPIRDAFPSNTILSSVCYVSCLQSMGQVSQVSAIKPHAFHIGVFGNGNTDWARDHQSLRQLVSLDSKFKAINNISAERWNKMIFNGAWNPVTTILGLDTHQVIKQSPIGLTWVRNLARDISTVGMKSGAEFSEDPIESIIKLAAAMPAIVPSMLQDARKRKQMEVESLCGTICRMADGFGLEVPTVKAVYEVLSQMNRDFMEEAEPVKAYKRPHIWEATEPTSISLQM